METLQEKIKLMTNQERMFFLTLIMLSDSNGIVTESQRRLASISRTSRRQVMNMVQRFRELSILEKESVNEPKVNHFSFEKSISYKIFEPEVSHLERHPSFSLLSFPPIPPYIINSLINPERENHAHVEELEIEIKSLKKKLSEIIGEEPDNGTSADGKTFEQFWDAYGLKKGKAKAITAWKNLSKKERQKAFDAIPAYKKDCAVNNRFMKFAQGYLNQKTWEDDFSESPSGKPKEQSLWGGEQILRDNEQSKYLDNSWK